tara:strand:+ start:1242 stop:1562 length:321 start_codon:yes stop_codon:yes gene_type:complete
MSYTKSDLQLSDTSLLYAILEVGKNLENSNAPLANNLLFNFNTYDEAQLDNMFKRIRCVLIKSIGEKEEDVLDIEHTLKCHLEELKDAINGSLCEASLPKPALKRS